MIGYLLRTANLLNLLLTAVLLLMLGYLLMPLTRASTAPVVAPAKPAAQKEGPEQTVAQPTASADYFVIAERNLFHPERIIPVEKKDEEKPLPKPDFVLYGTLIDGSTRIAFMDDLKVPFSTPGRGKRQHTIAQGGNLSGFILSEVAEDRVVMTRGAEKITVTLNDAQHKRKGPVETTPAGTSAPAGRQLPGQAASGYRPSPTQNPSSAPAASQAAPAPAYRPYQPETLRRSFRSIKK